MSVVSVGSDVPSVTVTMAYVCYVGVLIILLHLRSKLT